MMREKEGAFIIDESFLPFMGPHWCDQSAVRLIEQFGDRLMVIHSWTKIWSWSVQCKAA